MLTSMHVPVTLPSKCLPYPGVRPDDIQIRPYIGQDEILLAQINPMNMEKGFLQVLRQVLVGIDPSKLTLGDRHYLILWEYVSSFSEVLKVSGTCSHCLSAVQFTVDLQKLPVIFLPDSFSQPASVTLPVSKQEVRLQLLTIEDEIESENYQQKFGDSYLYRWARSISGADPIVKAEEMKNWPVKDIARIRLFHDQMAHGPASSIATACPNCKQEEDVLVPFQFEYFLPTGSTLRGCFGA